MNPLRTLVPLTASLSLVFFSSSCVATFGSGGSKPASKSSPASAAPADKKDDKARESQHKLEVAELKLRIAQMEAKAGEASDARGVAAAELEAQMAAEALANFTQKVRPMEVASTQLSLDQRKQRVLESQQELDELEAMYAQEQFADLTKELVLSRGRASLDMATRSLELEQRRAAQTLEFEHPRKERELTEKVTVATKALEATKARAERSAVERKLSMLQAEHARDEARRAADDGDEAQA